MGTQPPPRPRGNIKHTFAPPDSSSSAIAAAAALPAALAFFGASSRDSIDARFADEVGVARRPNSRRSSVADDSISPLAEAEEDPRGAAGFGGNGGARSRRFAFGGAGAGAGASATGLAGWLRRVVTTLTLARFGASSPFRFGMVRKRANLRCERLPRSSPIDL